MKYFVVGDIHIKPKHHERSVKLVDELIKTAQTKKPDKIILLGDVLDGADIIHSNCLLQLSRLLTELAKVSTVYLLMGNHDASTPHIVMPENHSLQCFKSLSNVIVVDKPLKISESVFALPYLPPGTFWDYVPSKCKLAFCHQEFEGAVFDSGEASTKGDPIRDDTLVIAGHIHQEQRLGTVWYVGTPAQTRFGESSNKHVYLLDVDEESGTYSEVERIRLSVPRFISHTYQLGTGTKNIKLSADDIHRAIVTGMPSEILAFKKSKEYSDVLETFGGNVRFNFKKEEHIVEESSEKKVFVNYQTLLSSMAKENGLESILSKILR